MHPNLKFLERHVLSRCQFGISRMHGLKTIAFATSLTNTLRHHRNSHATSSMSSRLAI